jgi:hypothetical protein
MGRMGSAARNVVIRLTHDEALVLFEVLHHWEDQDRVTQPEHHADQIALWNCPGCWNGCWPSRSIQPAIAWSTRCEPGWQASPKARHDHSESGMRGRGCPGLYLRGPSIFVHSCKGSLAVQGVIMRKSGT